MPWMIFYQQGAVVDKGLSHRHIRAERRDTAIGSILTQAIMIVMVVTFAATVGVVHPEAALNTVGQLSTALRPFLGGIGAKVLLGVAVLGAAMVAALVASLAGAWGMSEVFGWAHTLNERPNRQTAKFYVTYALAHVLGAAIVLVSVHLVSLVIDVEVMNALLLPIVLGFLLALESKALPAAYRMHGAYRVVATGMCLMVMGFGLYIVPATAGMGVKPRLSATVNRHDRDGRRMDRTVCAQARHSRPERGRAETAPRAGRRCRTRVRADCGPYFLLARRSGRRSSPAMPAASAGSSPRRSGREAEAARAAHCSADSTSSTQEKAAIAAGKPRVVMVRAATWRISSLEAPASKARRAFERTAPSASAPMAMPNFTRRCVRSSSGPAAAVARPRASTVSATSGKRSRNRT